MVEKILKKIGPRQKMALVVFALVLLCVYVVDDFIFPAFDELAKTRSRAEASAAELAKLKANLEAGKGLEETMRAYRKRLVQTEKDEVVLSTFAKNLEEKARYPSMHIVNMRPENTVREKGSCKLYGVKMALVAELSDLLAYLGEIMGEAGEGDVVGLESVNIRGIQGGSSVECSFTVYLVRIPSL